MRYATIFRAFFVLALGAALTFGCSKSDDGTTDEGGGPAEGSTASVVGHLEGAAAAICWATI